MGEDPITAAVTVNDGTFVGKNYSVWIGSDYNNPVNSTIQINGGTYEKPINTQENTRENAIIVYGGTFNAGIGTGENITISGASTSTTEGGKTTVTPNTVDNAVASIERGGKPLYYTSLNDAVAEARDGETVEVLKETTISSALEVKSNITIDGNGNTVTADKCAGLYIKADLSNLTVTDLKLQGVLESGVQANDGTGSYMGIGTYNDCFGVGALQLTNVTIDGFSYGLYFGKNPTGGIGPYNENPVSVTANNLTVQNCYIKGAYFEKLTDSTFTSCTFASNGTDPNKVASENMRTWMCGVDINLKNGSYENISFVGCTFTNNGANSGTALLIKARDDGNYGETTSLDGATVSGCTFSGNNGDSPVILGEPNKGNKTPVNVSIQSDVKYTSNVAAASNFTVTFNSNGGTEYATQLVAAGSEITLPTPTKSGYIFLGWRCGEDTYNAGATVKVTADMAFTAVWGNLPNVKPDTKPDEPVTEFPFYDVAASAWYYDAVKYVYDKGLMDGVDTHEFAPNATLTRAMVWTILARAEGVDTTGGASWYAKAQEWAVAKGVSDGENPNAAITREQLVTMLYRLAGLPSVTGSLTAPDASSVSSWAKDAMLWAMNLGLVEGDENGAVTPTATATRAQAAAIIMRYTAK
ncbi:MAG: S-layer homology domain-containing protein [Candidatus Scatomorpha sp.]